MITSSKNKILLKKCCISISDGDHLPPPKTKRGVPFITISNIDNNNQISFRNTMFVSKEYYDSLDSSKKAVNGDILYSVVGSFGKPVYIDRDDEFVFQRHIAILRPDNKVVDNRYLYYLLLNPFFYKMANRLATGVSQRTITLDSLRNLEIELPELSIQSGIAKVLSCLDRKIAINNAINAELEKAAKLIYDYWFVQYDFPDADGKPYRASGGEMVYNEQLKRDIPKGWGTKTLRQCVLSINTGLNPRQNFKLGTGKNRYITIKSIVDGRLDFSKCDFMDNEALEKIHNRSDISVGDILFSSIDPIGRLYWIREQPVDWDINESVFSIRTNEDVVPTEYLYAVMDSSTFRAKLIPLRTGSVQKGIRIGALEAIIVAFPNKLIVDSFASRVSPLHEQMGILEKQTIELTTLRDFLLPLLMNGQVTVAKTATKAVEDAADIPIAIDAKAKKAAVFKRLVLSAFILDNIYDEPTAGRVKFEKLLYLSEHCAQLPLHSEFHRAAAGPYDSQALHSIESQLQRNKWFKRQRVKEESRAYARMEKADNYKKYMGSNISTEQKTVIDKLIRIFKSERTIKCEIVATLYSAWNDFMIDGIQPTDEQIVEEVLTNWHENKERIERKRWLSALGWMNEKGVVPTGYGVSTKSTEA